MEKVTHIDSISHVMSLSGRMNNLDGIIDQVKNIYILNLFRQELSIQC
jgi:hypothetical protein